ncbi:TonB-dependent siderophore receptor [Alteromonas sp. RKMC-009]|uniref:TonB-dependent siderophore receptor n=1 Tax=Alteromonas sp. RKMC-009 TaxID=2267264 RepID=UPI000E68B239|nr:TonB-dependent receptor [Alteromonas sp. RKMC-009]
MQYQPLSLAVAAALTTMSVCAQDQQDVEQIEVKGRAQQFYLDSHTRLGTKTDADIMEIPLSVQVLTRQLIQDQAARDITDMYRSIAGVSEFSYSGVTFRGFRDDGNVFYDGVRGDPFSGFSVPQLFNVERVEVLKGPAASLYGGGEPGGMINYVSRKPSFEEKKNITLTGGNFSLAGASADFTGAVSDTAAYRLGGFYESQDSFRNNADSENIELAGGMTFLSGQDTTLTTTFDYIVQNLGGNRLRGVPVDDDGNFIVDRSYNANEKGDYQDLEALVLQANLTHNFTDNLSFNGTLRYLDNEREQAYHESRSWVDANGDGEANIDDQIIRREYRKQYRANDEISLTLDFVYDFDTGETAHQFLFGGDFHNMETEYDYFRARYEADGVANLNIFTLNYGITDPSTYDLTDMNRDGNKRQRMSAYIQDKIQFSPSLALLVGARLDHFDEENKETLAEYSDSDISPRAGLIYTPSDNTTVYLNYSQSFNPVDPNDFAEAGPVQLSPETGEQVELGLKQSWLDNRIMTTVAVYQIDKENLVIANPDYIEGENDATEPALINFGLVESEGAEFTLVGDLTNAISVTANYAYNDTRIASGETANTYDGTRLANTPRHQAGLWTRYAIDSIDSSVAFGVDYVSEQRSLDGQKVKPYTVFDASWTTSWDDLLLSINVRNLFDKVYAVSGFSERNGHFPGEPREIVVQLSYDF